MTTKHMAAAMQTHIRDEVPRLLPAASFPKQPLGNIAACAAIYEAYVYTCVVEAVERLKADYPLVAISWTLESPPTFPKTLVLRKKACSIATARGRYSYVSISVGPNSYELHTDVPTQGRSGVLSEIDVILLRAESCEVLSKHRRRAPQPSDVLLLIEAKFHSGTLRLGIGREFLGLRGSEFRSVPVGCLVSTTENKQVSAMLTGYGDRQHQGFWPNLDDLAAHRQAFVEGIARWLAEVLITRSSVRTTRGRSTSKHRVPAPLPAGFTQPRLFPVS